jgi:glutamine synthetase
MARTPSSGRAGRPTGYCPRVVLKRQLAALKDRGLTMYTGIEPEFMLLARGADGGLTPIDRSDTLDKPCYDYKGLARASVVLDELSTAVRGMVTTIGQPASVLLGRHLHDRHRII